MAPCVLIAFRFADDLASFQSTLVHNIEMRQIVIQLAIRMIGWR